ncbi:MAG TPA: LPS export ABC transporter permease LptF [Aliidongia sp.]|uniref:LPS export ABC transporter permease LptF n=1 Tax=Aliidongia sp. TaxID=1914230 RepID=UPI002DDD0A31|nr:LPS export ABC transporter permease LptF [Aliidongia sp.]HEV2678441.1 LPS export ABC transporter permease LptF [Aliidongia sp.]
MIINRYLIREIGKPLAAILGILVALFASYSAAGFLSEAVNGLLPIDTVAEMIGLKVLISLEVLIPISLYISVVLAFGRLYGDSEFTAMFALRITPARVMGAVVSLSGCLAIVVACLSLGARPWAYDKLHELSRHAELTLDVNAMEAGTFYVGQHGRRVIFVTHRDGPASPAQDVFVQVWHEDHTEIVHAQLAYPLSQTTPNGGREIYLTDAHIYELGHDDDHPDRALSAQGIVINPDSRDPAPPEYSSVAASSAELARSDSARDIAELQWRLSTPLSTLLLGMLGIPLSRARPRQGKYEKFGTAILVYSGYYLLCTSARTWVQHGVVAAFPGIWWAPALLAAFLAFSLAGPALGMKYRRSRA